MTMSSIQSPMEANRTTESAQDASSSHQSSEVPVPQQLPQTNGAAPGGGLQASIAPQGRSGATPNPPTTQLPFDPADVDDLSDIDLDALNHGAIALDAEGYILRYNLAEANLARLDRHTVIGRNFFEEVAPCTRTPEFEGAFRHMVETGAANVPRFAYLFDFKFGAQECDVEMVSVPDADRYYVFVTRKSFQSARPNLQEGWAAPLQSELAGDADVGVLRDKAEQRMVRVDADFLATLFTTAQELSATAWPRICYEWGRRWGRRLVVAMEMGAVQDHGAPLADLAFGTTMEVLQQRFRDGGWGDVAIDTKHVDAGVLVVDVASSVIADIIETGRAGEDARRTGVMLLEGALASVFTSLSGKQLTAVEVPGARPGGNVFVVVGEGLRPLALAAAGRSPRPRVDEVVATLAAGGPS